MFILMEFVLSAMFAQICNDLRSLCCVECPGDFTHVASVNGCYKVLNRNLEWSVAGLECRSLHRDAHLLVINNEREQLAIAGLLDSANRLYLYDLFVVPFAMANRVCPITKMSEISLRFLWITRQQSIKP